MLIVNNELLIMTYLPRKLTINDSMLYNINDIKVIHHYINMCLGVHGCRIGDTA